MERRVQQRLEHLIKQAQSIPSDRNQAIAGAMQTAVDRIDWLERQMADRSTLRDEMAMRFAASMVLVFGESHHPENVMIKAYKMADIALIHRQKVY